MTEVRRDRRKLLYIVLTDNNNGEAEKRAEHTKVTLNVQALLSFPVWFLLVARSKCIFDR